MKVSGDVRYSRYQDEGCRERRWHAAAGGEAGSRRPEERRRRGSGHTSSGVHGMLSCEAEPGVSDRCPEGSWRRRDEGMDIASGDGAHPHPAQRASSRE